MFTHVHGYVPGQNAESLHLRVLIRSSHLDVHMCMLVDLGYANVCMCVLPSDCIERYDFQANAIVPLEHGAYFLLVSKVLLHHGRHLSRCRAGGEGEKWGIDVKKGRSASSRSLRRDACTCGTTIVCGSVSSYQSSRASNLSARPCDVSAPRSGGVVHV